MFHTDSPTELPARAEDRFRAGAGRSGRAGSVLRLSSGVETLTNQVHGITGSLGRQRSPHIGSLGRALSGLLVVGLALGFSEPRAHAATPEAYRVDAQLDVETGELSGRLEIDVLVAAGEDTLRLWLLADRLAVAPTAMDEQSSRWIYPGRLDRGFARVSELFVDGQSVQAERVEPSADEHRGRDVAGSDLRVPIAAGEARRVRLSMSFEVHLPRRFGRLGRASGMLSLTAPWYPLLLGHGDPLGASVPQRVRLALSRGEAWAMGEPLPSGEAQDFVTGFVPVLVAPHFEVVEWREGVVRARLISPTRLYRDPRPEAQGIFALHDMAHVDVVAPIQRGLHDALETFAAVARATPPHDITLALVPSRTELAADAPGFVLLSDRLFQVTPMEALQAFHRRALMRALFVRLLAAPVDALEPAADRGLGLRLRATLLLDLDETRRHGHVRTPQELLGWAGFHPTVDQLLYAPQVAFVDAYFGSIAERDPFREAPSRARQPGAGGRRLLEHARDLLPAQVFRHFARGLLELAVPTRELLRRTGGVEALTRLNDWLREPELPVNYRLGTVHSTRLSDGHYRHVVVVERQGAERHEPVEVEITDTEGHQVIGRWDGVGVRGEVTIDTPAPRRWVTVDPRGRTDQSAAVAGGHPLADDTDHLPFRPPLLRSFVLSARATEGVLVGLVDFAIRRRYDLEHSVGVSASSDERSFGGSLRYGQGVGPKRDNNGRIGGVSVGVAMARLRPGFGVDGEGGVRTSLHFGAGLDSHRYFLDTRRGDSLSGSLSLGFTRSRSGHDTGTVGFIARGDHNIPLGLRGTLVLVAGAAGVFGRPLVSERPGLGGPALLRGYEADEVLGDVAAFAVAEARGTVLSDLGVDLFNLVWLRELQLIAFAGGGLVVKAVDGRTLVPGAELGAGLRLHFDYGGVQPALIGLDVAAPLIRTAAARASRPPVSFSLVFQQYF